MPPKIGGMLGTNSTTGGQLDGIAHLRQSVRDILATRIGTRIKRRDYGSRLPELIDAPLNRSTTLQLYAATADALQQWEPRIKVSSVKIVSAEPGSITIDLYGKYLIDGQPIVLDGIVIS
jgi:hypothetical protein